MIIITSEKCKAYGKNEPLENPSRIVNVLASLKNRKDIELKLNEKAATYKQLILAHSEKYLRTLKNEEFNTEELDTTIYPNIFQYASLSVGTSLAGVEIALSGKNTFCLTRPPGHHATKNNLMGFCFLNNIAISALYLKNTGVKRIAVLDIDNHYGNGTQEILGGLEGIISLDIHMSSTYPNITPISKQNCINFQLAGKSGEKPYLSALDSAIFEIKNFNPNILLVSAGFDTFKEDPLENIGLNLNSYSKISRKIDSLGLPTTSILEGGYSSEKLGNCISHYISNLK